MKLWGSVASLVVVMVGVIWILQGANILGGSFMSGQSRWLYIGIVVFVVGAAGFWWVNRR